MKVEKFVVYDNYYKTRNFIYGDDLAIAVVHVEDDKFYR